MFSQMSNNIDHTGSTGHTEAIVSLTLTETRLSCVQYILNMDNKLKINPRGIMIALKTGGLQN